MRTVREDRIGFVIRAPARRVVPLKRIQAHRAVECNLAARPRAQAERRAHVRSRELAPARCVPLGRAFIDIMCRRGT